MFPLDLNLLRASREMRLKRQRLHGMIAAAKETKDSKGSGGKFNKRLLEDYKKVSVWLVDAHAVRDSSVKAQDFGDWGVNEQFPVIPKGEGWISDELSADDQEFSHVAVLAMLEKLAGGATVDEAADYAEKKDAKARWIADGGKGKLDHIPEEAILDTYATTDGGNVTILDVDGEIIRDRVNVSWIEGGNGEKFPWIPDDTIIVESTLPDDEKATTSLHEFVEKVEIGMGVKYLKAHKLAAKIEFGLRDEFDKADVEAMTEKWAKQQLAKARYGLDDDDGKDDKK